MRLGFHYHTPYYESGNQIRVPGFIGVFMDALAREVEHLFLFLEEGISGKSGEADYTLTENNITAVSIGKASSFYKRLLSPKKKIETIKANANKIDFFLVRMPSPLGPHILKYFRSNSRPASALLVGNYIDGLQSLNQPFIRKNAIVALTHYYQHLQNKAIRNLPIVTNSERLRKENIHITEKIKLVKTTTIQLSNFFIREDTCQSDVVKILYTGRINFQKGLRELIESVSTINKKGINTQLDIVGWEEGNTDVYTKELKEIAKNNGIGDKVFFPGKQPLGPELNAFYIKSDIYTIPSYHEGFPRTIWEAMCHGLPVIATSVGSIPSYLSDGQDSIIIEPKNTKALTNSILKLITEKEFRKTIISGGYDTAKESTLDIQTGKLVNILKAYAKLS